MLVLCSGRCSSGGSLLVDSHYFHRPPGEVVKLLDIWCMFDGLLFCRNVGSGTCQNGQSWLETQLGSLDACTACVLHCLTFLDAASIGDRYSAHAVNPCISKRKVKEI